MLHSFGNVKAINWLSGLAACTRAQSTTIPVQGKPSLVGPIQ